MRQIWITKAGPPDVLQVREAPDPTPGAGEVRIRVQASGINFADLLARMGLYPDAPKLPCVVGYEVAGTVDALGVGVREFQVGQEVLASTHFGGYADVVCVPAFTTFLRPPTMSAQVGAGMLVTYVTAYQLLVVMGSLHRGERVLIQSAAGGVGLAALHQITHGEGVEIVLDAQGGPSWRQSYGLLAPTGRLLTFGVSSLAPGHRRSLLSLLRFVLAVPRFTPLRLIDENKGVLGVNVGHLWHKPHLLRGAAEQILAWYGAGKITPHIDRAFPFAQAPAAHQYLHDHKARGKVLLEP